MKREHVVFMSLSEQMWVALADKAEATDQTVEQLLSRIVELQVVADFPMLIDGSSQYDDVDLDRVAQVGQGMDKNELVAAFVKESDQNRRLYMKHDGQVMATYSHLILAMGRGKTLTWDIRGSFQDIVDLLKYFTRDCPAALSVLKNVVGKK